MVLSNLKWCIFRLIVAVSLVVANARFMQSLLEDLRQAT